MTAIPHLIVDGGDAAIDFYTRAFGATVIEKAMTEDGKRIMHAGLTIHGGTVFLMDDFPEYDEMGGGTAPSRLGGTSAVVHLDVPDADAAWQQALDAGAKVVMALDNQFWGMRYGMLKDPFGHVWSIGGPVK